MSYGGDLARKLLAHPISEQLDLAIIADHIASFAFRENASKEAEELYGRLVAHAAWKMSTTHVRAHGDDVAASPWSNPASYSERFGNEDDSRVSGTILRNYGYNDVKALLSRTLPPRRINPSSFSLRDVRRMRIDSILVDSYINAVVDKNDAEVTFALFASMMECVPAEVVVDDSELHVAAWAGKLLALNAWHFDGPPTGKGKPRTLDWISKRTDMFLSFYKDAINELFNNFSELTDAHIRETFASLEPLWKRAQSGNMDISRVSKFCYKFFIAWRRMFHYFVVQCQFFDEMVQGLDMESIQSPDIRSICEVMSIFITERFLNDVKLKLASMQPAQMPPTARYLSTFVENAHSFLVMVAQKYDLKGLYRTSHEKLTTKIANSYGLAPFVTCLTFARDNAAERPPIPNDPLMLANVTVSPLVDHATTRAAAVKVALFLAAYVPDMSVEDLQALERDLKNVRFFAIVSALCPWLLRDYASFQKCFRVPQYEMHGIPVEYSIVSQFGRFKIHPDRMNALIDRFFLFRDFVTLVDEDAESM